MWKQRIDNNKKFKPNAVLTIFEYFLKKKISFTYEKLDVIAKKHRLIYDKKNQIKVNDNQVINKE